MTSSALEELLQAQPFRPFTIVMGTNRVKVKAPADVSYDHGGFTIRVKGTPADIMLYLGAIAMIEIDSTPAASTSAGPPDAEVRRGDES